jgi:hypothetical protein
MINTIIPSDLTNSFSEPYNKIDILKKLLSAAFDSQLIVLENSARSHLACVETSIKTANSVALLCSSISKQVTEKLKEREKRSATPLKSVNKLGSSVLKPRAKTPKRGYSSNKSFSKLNMTMREGSKLQLNRSNGSLLLNKKQLKTSFISNKSYNTTSNTPSKRTNHLSNNINRPNINKPKLDHNVSMFSKRPNQISKSHTSSETIIPSNQKTVKQVQLLNEHPKIEQQGTIKLKSMESNIQNDLLINQEDPLLVSSQTDMDFIHKNILSLQSIFIININDFAEDNFCFILPFLNIKDITNLMSTNKHFNRIIKQNLISNLEHEKQEFQLKLNKMENDVNIDKTTKEEYIFKTSKGTHKATDLLNNPMLNKIFNDNQTLPINDIYRVFNIYFQIINHPFKNEIYDKNIFWRKCCDFFLVTNKGKTGDLLRKNVENDLTLTYENAYKIMHLIGDNISKITPAYFSKVCGTTGLFVFLIKDVLDYFGISGESGFSTKTYWTYKGIVRVIERKIDKIKIMKNPKIK